MSVRTKALLLNSIPVRESDLLLVLFTEKLGKVRGLAKGALRSKKRFLGTLLNLNELEIELAPARSREIDYRLENADLLKSRLALSREPERLACALVLAELIERASPELSPEPLLYRLLAQGIENISVRKNFREYFLHSLLSELARLGYMPSLNTCAIDALKLEPKMKDYLFSIERGGLVCGRHAGGAGLKRISPGLAQSLRAISREGGRSLRVRLSEKDWVAAVNLFFEFTAWHLERPLLSMLFLKNFLQA